MTEEEKKAAEEAAKAEKEKADADFEASLEGLSEEDKIAKRAEREAILIETSEQKAKRLAGKGEKRILVDQDRFNEINDQSKLYKVFAPIIDKVKGDPELVSKILGTNDKNSLRDRVAQLESEKKNEKERELEKALGATLSKWPDFEKDWPKLRKQVEILSQDMPVEEAMKRSYLALHPEEMMKEAQRMAQEKVNLAGTFLGGGGGRSPDIMNYRREDEPKLNERERKVAQNLLGKDLGGGFVLIKSEADYANLLKKNEDWLRARGFYDLP